MSTTNHAVDGPPEEVKVDHEDHDVLLVVEEDQANTPLNTPRPVLNSPPATTLTTTIDPVVETISDGLEEKDECSVSLQEQQQSPTKSTERVCLNKPDSFCYICGRPMFVKNRRPAYPAIIATYEKYFKRTIDDLHEPWTPNCFCTGCTGQLYNWENRGRTSGASFGVPMIWRKPKDDHSDCYFCVVPRAVINMGHKNRKRFQYPDASTVCVSLPLPHSDLHPVPEPPKRPPPVVEETAKSVTTTEPKDDHVITESEGFQIIAERKTTPEPFTAEDFELFLKELAPLTPDQRQLLTSTLKTRNLLIETTRQTRTQTSGKRKTYVFALPSPKRSRRSVRSRRSESTNASEDEEPEETEAEYAASGLEEDDYGDSDGDFSVADDDDSDSDFEVHDSLLKNKFDKILTISMQCMVANCTTVVGDKKEMDKHLAEAHQVQKHRCLVVGCRSSFKNLREFRGHQAVHHADVTNYPCGRCPNKGPFTTYYGLKTHILRHHVLGHYRCGYPDCNFSLTDSYLSKMVSHIDRVHTEAMFVCPFEGCERSFKYQGALDRHEKTHTGEKLFDCQFCGRSFATDKEMELHVRTHTGDLPFECPVCQKRYARKGTLDRHVAVHEEPKHVCSFCGKAFKWENSLKNHVNKHNDVKPYQCEHCGKRFSWPSNLGKHRRNGVCTVGPGKGRSRASVGLVGPVATATTTSLTEQQEHPPQLQQPIEAVVQIVPEMHLIQGQWTTTSAANVVGHGSVMLNSSLGVPYHQQH